MNKMKILALSIFFLFMVAALPALAAPAATGDYSSTPEWKVDEKISMVYNVTQLVYNETEKSLPVYDYEEGTFLGNITEGSEIIFMYDTLPDPSSGYTNMCLHEKGSITTSFDWEFNYTVPLTNDNDWASSHALL